MKDKKNSFNKMTDGMFNDTIINLVSDGLVEKIIVNGIEHYQLTNLGKIVSDHLDSDPLTRN